MKPQLRTVRKVAGDAGQIEPLPLSEITLDRAALAHPFNSEHQRRWLSSIKWLRDNSKRGWIADQRQHKLKEPMK